ncbi:ABC transporter ATP-binding protein [Halalkalibacterium halodurans]|uniref:ABC transporter (ATP-binding protein) n=1 Tax=Halalkalibacterium halodurans (strain ATCC BAA-125 / DSM 18197 / FERM 7344 / JCM 9153 / C-125) TaxID=272558 RepID=Q9KFN4_HALH5|nr:ABC transporter ATP-binding protein [Halalkalibacterium halodurans]MED4082508.1 ABC transporter ATP-binding protein [Halalkalibacterium halodurans]MED4085753.1 ABC transporter ATP-binding protein [Halalkalibacterium halodurans]MED4105619.1 ABC transporter ATP-binding protein [Halalkalibacterium halodurans]MED4107508.1 ABC transporter ATP-binding protein [Halalkalibacterium halodurans]MED4122811.1 ABC transporter ATP-binding protein [Halalkalibacterium halodurans]
MTTTNYLIETNNLTMTYKHVHAVDRINLKVKEGEIYGFLGPNGAGKTTTIRMLLGLIKASHGSIKIFGKDLKQHRLDILKNIGALVESPSYYPHLSGEDNLETVRKIVKVPKSRIAEVLELVRLTKVADRKVQEYSLGMKQRLAIAAALLANPRLVILDEPTNGLDPAGIIEIRNLILRLPKEYGITVLLSSHLLSEVEQVASQVGIIAKGKLIFQDSIEELRKKANRKIFLSTSHPEVAATILQERGINVDTQARGLVMNDRSDEEIAQLVKAFVEKDIDVYRISDETSSLEEIFLQLTKGGQTL